MSNVDPRFIEFGLQCARDAAGVIMDLRGRTNTTDKAPFDVVTEADFAVERMVIDRIASLFPSHGCLAEESARQSDGRLKEWMWILDPVDGTSNFASGAPVFAFSLALLHHGSPVLGWVHDPLHEELFFAQRGEGAYLNERRITSDGAWHSPFPVGASSGFLKRIATRSPASLGDILDHFGKTRIIGSQALQLAYVACGRLRAAVNVEAKLWDDAAGSLIVEESGGRYCDFRGEPVFPLRDGSPLLLGKASPSIALPAGADEGLIRLLAPLA